MCTTCIHELQSELYIVIDKRNVKNKSYGLDRLIKQQILYNSI